MLKDALKNKSATIGIVGLGYVGLPLAIAFAQANFKVVGFDVQAKKVDAVNKGNSYIVDVTDKALREMTSKKNLIATTDLKALSKVNAICVCVPTPFTRSKNPDLSYVIQTAKDISKILQPGQLVVLESTTYPGTTREVMLPILMESGLKAEKDFFLAFSPERVDPGNKKFNFHNTPKVVGGYGKKSTDLAFQLYSAITDKVVPVSSLEIAELTKLLENVFRNVNIALVNEMALLCEKMGLSIWEVIDAAATKPFGYMPFYPGPGVGGHCIPKDPYYLEAKAREYDFHTRFIELAAGVNEQMPAYTASRIVEEMSRRGLTLKESKILVLGVSFKKDIEDSRESPSMKLIESLMTKNGAVAYNDPRVPEIKIGAATLKSVAITAKKLAAYDCIVIATDHSDYDYQSIIDNGKFVFDTRGVTRRYKKTGDNVVMLGESTNSQV